MSVFESKNIVDPRALARLTGSTHFFTARAVTLAARSLLSIPEEGMETTAGAQVLRRPAAGPAAKEDAHALAAPAACAFAVNIISRGLSAAQPCR